MIAQSNAPYDILSSKSDTASRWTAPAAAPTDTDAVPPDSAALATWSASCSSASPGCDTDIFACGAPPPPDCWIVWAASCAMRLWSPDDCPEPR